MVENSVDMRKLLDDLESGYAADRNTMKENGTYAEGIRKANSGRIKEAEIDKIINHSSEELNNEK